jgi:hypothetical protein
VRIVQPDGSFAYVLTRISLSPLQKNLSEGYQVRRDFAQLGVSVFVMARCDPQEFHPSKCLALVTPLGENIEKIVDRQAAIPSS